MNQDNKLECEKRPKFRKNKSSRINILGKNFKIIWKAPENPEKSGQVDLDNQIITIDPKLSEYEKKEHLIHEAFHVFSDYYGLEDSEILIHALTKFFLDLEEKV